MPDTEFVFGPDDAPGLTRQDRYAVVGGATTLDWRDNAPVPTRGTWVSAALWHATGLSASAAPDINRVVTEARWFHALPDRAHVVALRALVSSRVFNTATPSPFYLQPTLGGSQTLRGLHSFQLRGDAVWAASLDTAGTPSSGWRLRRSSTPARSRLASRISATSVLNSRQG